MRAALWAPEWWVAEMGQGPIDVWSPAFQRSHVSWSVSSAPFCVTQIILVWERY